MLSREDRDICDNIEKYIGHCFVGKNESINWASISMVIIGKEVRSLKAFFVLSALYCRVWLLWHWAFLSSNPTICMPVFQRRNWLYASLFFFSFFRIVSPFHTHPSTIRLRDAWSVGVASSQSLAPSTAWMTRNQRRKIWKLYFPTFLFDFTRSSWLQMEN